MNKKGFLLAEILWGMSIFVIMVTMVFMMFAAIYDQQRDIRVRLSNWHRLTDLLARSQYRYYDLVRLQEKEAPDVRSERLPDAPYGLKTVRLSCGHDGAACTTVVVMEG